MPKIPLSPFWQTPSVQLYHGHVVDVLNRLPERSVHCCVTSPPYWGLRDYGVEGQLGSEPSPDCGTQGQAQCGRCFVCSMVKVFRGVRRVLRDDGTLWLNLGDTYQSGKGEAGGPGARANGKNLDNKYKQGRSNGLRPNDRVIPGLPSGNLVGVPWRVALALQADGWMLRQDAIWHKPNPMPESVRNRCTKAHEYVFLLTKSMRYFCDMTAIKEPHQSKNPDIPWRERNYGNGQGSHELNGDGSYKRGQSRTPCGNPAGGRNKRSVWSLQGDDLLRWLAEHRPEVLQDFADSNKGDVWKIASQGYPGAHFATFPPKLIEPMILAGTSAEGCCGECGAPYSRIVDKHKLTRERPNDYVKRNGQSGTGNSCPNSTAGVETITVGWESGCTCDADTVPCTVLDPFVGSGTTCCVANAHGRHSVGIDLSEKYLTDNAIPRILESKCKCNHA